MNESYLRSWLAGLVIVVAMTSLSGCLTPGTGDTALPSGDVPLLEVTTVPSGDAPATAVSLDDAAGVATASPMHEVRLGETNEIAPAPSRRYRVRMEDQSIGVQRGVMAHKHSLYLHDNETDQEFRLGDDSGQADFEAMDDQYLVWRWSLCDPWPCQDRAQGLYAYDLTTGEQAYIGLGIDVWMSNQWIIFTSDEGADKRVGLRAYNLETGDEIVIARARAAFLGIRTMTLYHINEGMIAWVDYDEESGQMALAVFDLSTSTRRILDIPGLFGKHSPPSQIRVSRTQVVWRDETQRGYDLRYDVIYAIPIMPPGLEDISADYLDPILVSGNYVTWGLEINGQARYFMAPVIVDGEVSPLPSPLPTATVVYQSIFHDPPPEPLPTETPEETPTPETPTDTPTPRDTPIPTATDTPTTAPTR